MRIRGSLASGLLISLAFALIPVAAVSAQKITPGSACKVLNQKVVYQSKSYTCTKSGKKLIWNKGVAIKNPTPTPTPTPTPKIEIVPAMPTSFADLEERYKGIPDSVWADAEKLFAQPLSTPIKVDVEKGESTKILYSYSEIEYGISRAQQLGGTFPKQSKFIVVAFNFTDRDWAKTRLSTIASPFTLNDTFSDQVSVACSSQVECDSAFGNISLDSGLIIQGVSGLPNSSNTRTTTIRSHYAHETTHTIQKSIYKKYGLKRFSIPCWFSEGQPQVVGQTSGSANLIEYVMNRRSWLRPPLRGLPDFSEASINKFFDLQHQQPCDSATRQHIYDIGFIAVEALASVGGISSTFDVLDKYASGMTFDQAFEKVYGISWANAKPILARTISKQFLEAR
jgi:hypothetical protein